MRYRFTHQQIIGIIKERQAGLKTSKGPDRLRTPGEFMREVFAITPGKPLQSAFIESFNGLLRAECLNASWFLSLQDVRSRCEA